MTNRCIIRHDAPVFCFPPEFDRFRHAVFLIILLAVGNTHCKNNKEDKNMIHQIQAFLLACRIEHHWWFVLRYQKLFQWLHEHGEAINSGKMLRINKSFMRHVLIIQRYEAKYEKEYVPIVGGVL